MPSKRSDRVVLEANLDYWDATRFPKLQRIIFENAIEYQDAIELVKTHEGRVDLVTELRPLDTLRIAQSPFATVVKNRRALVTVFGYFNMRKTRSPWVNVRLRQAINYAINRADLIRYATKGNGEVIPAMIPGHGFGYNPDLTPYPFDPDTARRLLQEVGYPAGRPLTLIAPKNLAVQATVISKMLEHLGLSVAFQILDPDQYNQQTLLSPSDLPAEQRSWDIALAAMYDPHNFPIQSIYHWNALDGAADWVLEAPELRRLYEEVLSTVDRERQQALLRQMERHTHAQAYFLFLYNPIKLYAVNKAVEFVPYMDGILNFAETAVTEKHWSVRKQKAGTHE